MPVLSVGGVTIPVAPGGVSRDRLDAVDRARRFDNSYSASQTGNPKRDFHFSTPPVSRSLADAYEATLGQVAAQLCWGDILGGSENLILQSENFLTSWGPVGTPVNASAGAVGALALTTVTDDSAAAVEGYEQSPTFTGNGVKAVSLHVNQGTSISSGFFLADTTAALNRLLGYLTWSGGLPVLAMTTGTYLGYETLTTLYNGVYRLKFATTSVTAANANTLRIYPAYNATDGGVPTGSLILSGVQAENTPVPSSYAKTTTATVNTINLSCCSEITGWAPVRTADGHRVVINFVLHEV